jgi:hypothetical protein
MDKPGFGEDTRAARTGWVEGDEVVIMLGEDLEHLISLYYNGTSWEEMVTYLDVDTFRPMTGSAPNEYLASLPISGDLKAIYCSSGIFGAKPFPDDAETVEDLEGIDIISYARNNEDYDEDLEEFIPNPYGECIMTCDKGDNGTYTVSEGVLTLNITMKPRVAQYTIRNLNVANGWSIAIHGPVNFYAGACFTEEKIVLTPIEYALYGYPHQNGNDISIFAAPWQSNADIPDFMLEELPPDFEMPVNMYQTVFYEFTVNDEGSNVFGREFDFTQVAIGGAVIMDGPYTEDEDGNKTTGAQEWI